VNKFPKVIWVSDKESEEIAGRKRRYENSWIKGICDRELNTISLNTRLRELKYPNFYEAECLAHEFTHFLFRHEIIDNILDKIGLAIDIYLYNRSCRRNYRRRKCK